MVYLVPGSGDAHATWITTGAPTVLVVSLVTLNGHQGGPGSRYAPIGATGLGATGRGSWPTPLAITEAMAARTRPANKTLETQRRRAGRLAPKSRRSSGPSGSPMPDDCTPRPQPPGRWLREVRDGLIGRIPALTLHTEWLGLLVRTLPGRRGNLSGRAQRWSNMGAYGEPQVTCGALVTRLRGEERWQGAPCPSM
jgi:hypothetical protein